MAEFPKELHYSQSHEWVRVENDDVVTVGITDHAQHSLGDLVFVELPNLEAHVDAGDEVAVVESVKTAADVYAPMSGEVIEINESLQNQPSVVNHDPYGDGWLFRLRIDDVSELDSLMDAEAYETEVSENE
ncbi:MAG: glycine cleavage system protein H [Coxiella sp. RIFCSPHIGHO2_12_FULL_44_14]|nr:MAG: glycine cleavage system protein H [Coxiella sp. RIFCSPHIGHO2_12_FULL_44_14]